MEEGIIPIQKILADEYQYNAEHIDILYSKIDNIQNNVKNLIDKTQYNERRVIKVSKNIK